MDINYYQITILVLYIMGLGAVLVKLGEPKKGKYGLENVLFNLLMIFLFLKAINWI